MRFTLALALFACSLLFLAGQDILPAEGDLDNNGAVEAADAVVLVNYLSGNLTTLLTNGALFTTDDIVGNLRF